MGGSWFQPNFLHDNTVCISLRLAVKKICTVTVVKRTSHSFHLKCQYFYQYAASQKLYDLCQFNILLWRQVALYTSIINLWTWIFRYGFVAARSWAGMRMRDHGIYVIIALKFTWLLDLLAIEISLSCILNFQCAIHFISDWGPWHMQYPFMSVVSSWKTWIIRAVMLMVVIYYIYTYAHLAIHYPELIANIM